MRRSPPNDVVLNPQATPMRTLRPEAKSLIRRVIAAFPATGKSHYASLHSGVADSDSSAFSLEGVGADTRRHPNWPANYLAHINALLDEGATVLVSTHAVVRQALVEAAIPFTLVYPQPRCLGEYVKRMRERGSSEALIQVVATNWRAWLTDCFHQVGCDHIVLGPGEYLSDVLDEGEKAA